MSKLLQIETPRPAPAGPQAGVALLRLGFRPFYLLGALFGALAAPAWIAMFAGWVPAPSGMPPMLWHAHEMVFGFAVAIVAGFLFTAVRNWTNLPTPTGARLAALCLLWVAARGAWFAGWIVAALAIELAFLALVAISLLAVLVRARNRRNYFVGVLFLVLASADVAFGLAASGALGGLDAARVVRFALYLVVMLTFVIAGRVVPMFTLNAVRGTRQFKDPRLDRAAIAVAGAAFLLDLAGLDGAALAAVATLAAVLHAIRLAGWNPLASRGRPILWILHVSCAWAPVGLLLLAAGALGWVPRSLALHAFATGVIGGLIIGMITRTALGHTGRMLVAGRAESAMYWLVQAAVLLRVAGPLLIPQRQVAMFALSSACWSLAFLAYVAVYWPMLSRPRVDGREG